VRDVLQGGGINSIVQASSFNESSDLSADPVLASCTRMLPKFRRGAAPSFRPQPIAGVTSIPLVERPNRGGIYACHSISDGTAKANRSWSCKPRPVGANCQARTDHRCSLGTWRRWRRAGSWADRRDLPSSDVTQLPKSLSSRSVHISQSRGSDIAPASASASSFGE